MKMVEKGRKKTRLIEYQGIIKISYFHSSAGKRFRGYLDYLIRREYFLLRFAHCCTMVFLETFSPSCFKFHIDPRYYSCE